MAEYVCVINPDLTYRPVDRIVRCRDCKHSWNDGRTCSFFTDFDDGHIIPASVEPDGFCAWGKPREGE